MVLVIFKLCINPTHTYIDEIIAKIYIYFSYIDEIVTKGVRF